MASPTELQLRGLILSAADLRQLTEWPEALIEDYLNILNNLVTLSNEIDEKEGSLKTTIVITSSPYTPTTEDNEILVDTTAEDISITLPPGINGTQYRITNIGKVGNEAIIIPDGLELLFGDNTSEPIYDLETFIITYTNVEGWY